MKKISLFFVFGLFVLNAMAQPSITWQKTYGGSNHEYAWKTIPTTDDGYAFVGYSKSNDGDVLSQNKGAIDLWVAKTNSTGVIQWSYLYGGSGNDKGYDILQTADGGYMVVGSTESTDGGIVGHHGTSINSDVWVLKLTSTGTLDWNKCYGGTFEDEGVAIAKTQNGDYFIAGSTFSNNGDVSGNHASGYRDFWVFKINATGTLLNQKCIGGTNYDEAYNMIVTSDDGCIVVGRTGSSDGDCTGYHGGADMLIAKLNSGLVIEWAKCYGGSETEECNAIVQLADGSYAALGYSSTHNNGDVSGHHGSQGSDDFWLLKLTSTGIITWAKCYGGNGDDQANGLTKTADGGFVMCGLTNSTNGDVSGFHSGGFFDPDVWVAKVDGAGNFLWQRCCGGSGQDESFNVLERSPNQYVVTGFSYSADYDITQNRGSADGWIFNLAGATSVEELSTNDVSVFPNPFGDALSFEISQKYSMPEKIIISNIYGSPVVVIKDVSLLSSNKINTQGLAAGIYFLEISGEGYRVVCKIVKD